MMPAMPIPLSLAYHTDKERLTDGTAYTLGRSSWKLGLRTAELGAQPRLDFFDVRLPRVLRVANLGAKHELPLTDRLSGGAPAAPIHPPSGSTIAIGAAGG